MSWKNKEEMFPTGFVPNEENLRIDILEEQNYDGARAIRSKKARKMLTQITSFQWNSDGTLKKEDYFNIFLTSMPDCFSCLNVYGKKMILNYLDKVTMEEENNNDRFNYTGI